MIIRNVKTRSKRIEKSNLHTILASKDWLVSAISVKQAVAYRNRCWECGEIIACFRAISQEWHFWNRVCVWSNVRDMTSIVLNKKRNSDRAKQLASSNLVQFVTTNGAVNSKKRSQDCKLSVKKNSSSTLCMMMRSKLKFCLVKKSTKTWRPSIHWSRRWETNEQNQYI